MPLSFEEERRYSRHLILPGVGLAGQERLQRARVLLVGAGGLGSPVAMYLAAAGVGTLGIADADVVDETNLQRQILHGTEDVGRLKVDSATDRLSSVNPLISVIPIPERITADNALDLIAGYDLVIDGTDNFPTRYLLNDACVLLGKPLIFGSIFRFDGQATVFHAQQGPCYRCIFPDPPAAGSVPTCAEGGVLGVLPGLIGMIQATETIKLLLGLGETLIGRLLMVDAASMRFREVTLEKNPDCPCCGHAPSIRSLIDYPAFCGVAPLSPEAGKEWEITPDALRALLQHGSVCLVDLREEHEIASSLPGALHIPYPVFARRMGELDSSDDIVLYCASGARSWQAVSLLRNAGFTKAWSLRGGMNAFLIR